jgi:hypothetical protein
MKKLYLYITLILLGAIVSCTPYKQISTETIEPASFAVPYNVNNVGFVFKKPSGNIAVDNHNKLRLNMLEEMKKGIADIASSSPRFNLENLHVIDTGDIARNITETKYTKKEIQKITKSSKLDAIIVLHTFELDDSLKEEIIFEADKYFYYLFKIKSNALWRFYIPDSKDFIIDEYNYSEEFAWEALDYTKEKALNELPDYSKAFYTAAYWTAVDYLKRFAPTWKQEKRIIFTRGNKYFEKAFKAFQEKKWEKAVVLWKKTKDHRDNELRSRALYNIAVTSELMGKVDLAIVWAKKSYKAKPKPRTKEYIERLQERKEDIKKLRKQLP